MSSSVHVIGGSGGVAVEYDDLGSAAHVLQTAALDVVATALAARGVLTDAGLLAGSVLDPGGFARVETAVLAAVLGPHGLLPTAARLEERSAALRLAVLRYAAADHLDTSLRGLRQWAEGTAAAGLLPLTLLLGVGAAASVQLSGRNPSAFLAEHPGIAQDMAGSAPAFLNGLLLHACPAFAAAEVALSLTGRRGPISSLEDAAHWLGELYPAATAVVVGRGTDRSAPPPPHSVRDLLLALEHRDLAASGDAQGEIDVRRLTRTAADGAQVTSWIVDLPGTKDWDFDPRHRPHLNDLATNLTTTAGDHSTRIDGVTRALVLAGVGKDDPVMLVGHSQGGLVALRAAEQYTADSSFNVTHVVTVGSPTARMQVPPTVSVLSLENRYDVVPQLDGRPPPDQPNRVTVMIEVQHDDVGLNHSISTTYLPGAAVVDGLTDPSLADWREGAVDFLTPLGEPVSVRTTVWDIRSGR